MANDFTNNNSAAYANTRVLVVGGTGFIGRWVAKQLSDENAELLIIGRDAEKINNILNEYEINSEIIKADLGEVKFFKHLYDKVKPDIVFNLAGYGINRDEKDENCHWLINHRLPEEIAHACSVGTNRATWNGLKFVHVGSGFEYGSLQGLITEESSERPNSIYGQSKLAGTNAVRKFCADTGLRAAVARIFTVYGPGENSQRLLPSIINSARTGEPLKLTHGMQKRDFTYVKDVASGILKMGLLGSVPGCVVNIATGQLISVREFAEAAGNLLNMPPSQLMFGSIPSRDDELSQGNVGLTKLTDLLGWNPVYSITHGIEDTIKFVMKNSARR